MSNKKNIVKSSISSIFIFLLAAIFWYFLRKLFLWNEGRINAGLIYAFIFFSIFIIFSLVYLILIDNRKIIIVTSLFVSLGFLFFFLRENNGWVSRAAIIAYIISAFILLTGYSTANRNLTAERKNNIKFYPVKIISRAVPAFMIISRFHESYERRPRIQGHFY